MSIFTKHKTNKVIAFNFFVCIFLILVVVVCKEKKMNCRKFTKLRAAIMTAIKNNNMEVVKKTFKNGYIINYKELECDDLYEKGHTVLHQAIVFKRMKILKYLINEQNADYFIKNLEKDSLLHYAALHNALEIAKFLLKKGLDPNKKNEFGRTPLFLSDSKEMIDLLLKNGANINEQDMFGKTVLHRMVSTRFFLAKYLIAKGAGTNIYTTSKPKLTAVDVARRNGTYKYIFE